MPHQIPSSSFQFLKDLGKNNNRDWFNRHKAKYLTELEKVELFADELLLRMKKYDAIETESGKKSLKRIYRDTRFAIDKTPYKTNWSGNFQRQGKLRRGGYYFRFQPGDKSFIAGGFRGPEPRDLKLIRDEFAFDETKIRGILSSASIKKMFGGLTGETLVSMPRGFSKDHPAADLIRHKQFILKRSFTDKEVLSASFMTEVVATMRAFRPFFDYMSEALYVPE